jgi:hypothetical protein
MAQEYKYFTIRYASVPQDPSFLVWYASWSETRPTVAPDMGEPLVVGCITSEQQLPAGATLIGTSTKHPTPPPPPPPLIGGDGEIGDALTNYRTLFDNWLTARRGG